MDNEGEYDLRYFLAHTIIWGYIILAIGWLVSRVVNFIMEIKK